MTPRRYPSRMDAWIAWLVGLPMGWSCLLVLLLIAAGRIPPAEAAFAAAMLASVGGLVAWVFAATGYTLDDAALTVRSGPFRWRIPYDRIERVVPTRNPLSSPALSLHRLEIRYGGGRVIRISPRERADFLRELAPRLRPGAVDDEAQRT